MLEIFGNIFFGFLELIGYGFFTSTKKTDFEKNVEELNKEEWFNQLHSDYRYRHVIHDNWKIGRFLYKRENVVLLISDQLEREKFIKRIKDEHERITLGKKRDNG